MKLLPKTRKEKPQYDIIKAIIIINHNIKCDSYGSGRL
jgi:hypothetical protein